MSGKYIPIIPPPLPGTQSRIPEKSSSFHVVHYALSGGCRIVELRNPRVYLQATQDGVGPRHERAFTIRQVPTRATGKVPTEVSNSLKILMIFKVSVGGLVSNDEVYPELGFLLELMIPPDQQPEELGCA